MFSFLKSKSFWAKALGWVSGALGMYAASNPSSKYGALAGAGAPILAGWGIHLATSHDQVVAAK